MRFSLACSMEIYNSQTSDDGNSSGMHWFYILDMSILKTRTIENKKRMK